MKNICTFREKQVQCNASQVWYCVSSRVFQMVYLKVKTSERVHLQCIRFKCLGLSSSTFARFHAFAITARILKIRIPSTCWETQKGDSKIGYESDVVRTIRLFPSRQRNHGIAFLIYIYMKIALRLGRCASSRRLTRKFSVGDRWKNHVTSTNDRVGVE